MDVQLNLLKTYLSNLDFFDLSELTEGQRRKLSADIAKLCRTLRDTLKVLEESE